MNKIDSLTNSILSRNKSKSFSRNNSLDQIEGEPNFTIISRGFFKKDKWKCFNRCYTHESDAYATFNSVMSKLEKLPNIELDIKKSRIIKIDTGGLSDGYIWRYYVKIF